MPADDEREIVPDPTTTAQIVREVDLAQQQMSRRFVSMHEYVDLQMATINAIFEEQRRGVLVAEQEREKSAAALREGLLAIIEGDRRAIAVAEQEREKAAKALRVELARAISDGDQNLREHITQQVHQIREALDSAEKLEVQRMEGLRREMTLIFAASEEAIGKADIATEKRFQSVNEFRGQLSDVIANFMPREVADAQFADMRRTIADLAEKVSKLV